jgi:hypothetical protein
MVDISAPVTRSQAATRGLEGGADIAAATGSVTAGGSDELQADIAFSAAVVNIK